jgi:hypothetical protein
MYYIRGTMGRRQMGRYILWMQQALMLRLPRDNAQVSIKYYEYLSQ